MDPQQFAIGSLSLIILGWMVTRWIMDTLKRIKTLEDSEGEQNVKIAVIEANMEHIKVTGDQTSKDVKLLLKANGNRATG